MDNRTLSTPDTGGSEPAVRCPRTKVLRTGGSRTMLRESPVSSASSGLLLVEQPCLGDGKLVVAERTGSVELVELSQSAHQRIRLS
jgi:hypothetical protein